MWGNIADIRRMINRIKGTATFSEIEAEFDRELLRSKAKSYGRSVETCMAYLRRGAIHAVPDSIIESIDRWHADCEYKHHVFRLDTWTDNIVKAYAEFVNSCLGFKWEWQGTPCSFCSQRNDCIAGMLSIVCDLLEEMNSYERDTVTQFFPKWSQNLYSDKNTSNRNFLVSFSEGTRALRTNYPIISCSCVNSRKQGTYKGYRFGFLYCPKDYEVVGMSPSDSGVTTSNYSYNSSFQLLVDELFGDRIFSERFRLEGVFQDFMPCYRFRDFMNKTEDYNEVVLLGDTEPIAVFCFEDALAEHAFDIFTLSMVAWKPLVVFNPDDDSVKHYWPRYENVPTEFNKLFKLTR